MWASVKQLTGTAKHVALLANLAGEALDLVHNEEITSTYEDLVQLLRTNYAAQAKKFYYELQNLKRNMSKTVSDYNSAFQTLRNKAKPYLNNFTEVEMYVSGLEPAPLREKLAINNPTSLRNAMELAQKLDNLF